MFDDIRRRGSRIFVNNFWRALAHDPQLLKRTWESVKQVMAPGALDPLTKELIYLAVSTAQSCEYCVRSHTAAARAKGMTPLMHLELASVIGMAAENQSAGYTAAGARGRGVQVTSKGCSEAAIHRGFAGRLRSR